MAATQRVIAQDASGRARLLERTPLPELLPGTVLIKTAAVALNPSDNKLGAAFPTEGAVVGMDYAGTVCEVTEGHGTSLQVGDAVFGAVFGSNPADEKKHALAVRFFGMFQDLLDRGKIVPHPVEVLDKRGLEGVLDGLPLLRAGKVSGKKLVVELQ
ncbi:hypothetical protein F4780DRAFT_455381 [Xylariomycetidae sp. FL0641]|nr:hypothetical protein F4780DRAFT_455381 [Xylariomycetidae sp. FL0641]